MSEDQCWIVLLVSVGVATAGLVGIVAYLCCRWKEEEREELYYERLRRALPITGRDAPAWKVINRPYNYEKDGE